jgi:hypothetical protein
VIESEAPTVEEPQSPPPSKKEEPKAARKSNSNGKVKTLLTQLSDDNTIRRKKTVHEGIEGEVKEILKRL